VNAWKKEQKLSGRRLDCHIGNQASWRIGKLAQAWDCSLSSAVERLILEADSRYSSILFPEERDESKVEAVPASDCDMTADEERIIWAKVAKRKSG